MASVETVGGSVGQAATSKAKAQSDKDMFLKMMLVQMRNQDPLKPMDSTEYTRQLTAFTQLEQSIETNEKLENLGTTFGMNALAQASVMIGKSVAINLPTSVLGEGGARWDYHLSTPAEQTTLKVVDSKGNVVASIPGEQGAGDHHFTWDGMDSKGRQLPHGQYSLQVEAATAGGNSVASWVAGRGTVQSVHLDQGSLLLDLGGASVGLEHVLTVEA